uniref:TSC complex subunit 1b n=1 Tax=Gadus morhua TaxID=8049 RepID=A0A8C5F9P2_GADMO
MAREQPNVLDLLPLLDTSDLRLLEETRGLINDHLNAERGSMLLNGLVDYFLETNSAQAMHILSSVREPHDKHLLDKMHECMTRQACRLPTLTLLGHVVRKQPSWIHKISRYPLLVSLIKCLKTDSDVVVLITGVLVLITLLPMIPQAGKQHLGDFFDIFRRLASWNQKNPGHVSEVYMIHLHAGVYSLFHRLYGMYPCNFVSYLRAHYSMKENMETFEEVVKPMLEHVRIHPELVTGTKDHELDPTRWKKFEVHDIVIECAKVSLDPKEASCEEGYTTIPENFYPYHHLRCLDRTASPHTDLHSSYGQWSLLQGQLTDACRMNMNSCMFGGKGTPASSTPATSSPPPTLSDDYSLSLPTSSAQSSPPRKVGRLSPVSSRVVCVHTHTHTPIEVTFMPAISEELLKLTEEKRDPSGLRGFDSPFYHTTETLTGRRPPDKTPPCLEQSWSFPSCFTPIDHHLHRSPSAPAEEGGGGGEGGGSKFSGLFSPSRRSTAPAGSASYEPLFDLALPRLASLFVGRRTSEAVQQGEEEEAVAASPLEVLDRLVQQGSDAHDKVLRRLPLPSKSADWTHFGGSAPQDELQTLRSQLLLLHSQLQYERHKREQHAVRNRRLLRRIINATALQEQNIAMKDQLSLQSVDVLTLRESLQVEQQRYRQLWEDRETLVTRLHCQVRQLQQTRDDYYTKNQELQGKLQECQKKTDRLEAELQKANNKVCHTGHLLNQMNIKLSSSESTQQQMSFLNKQLLLLGEVHRLAALDAAHTSPHNAKESQMLQAACGHDVERLRQGLVLQGQKLEAAQHRVVELDTHLSKKEHLITEQKKFLEDVKGQAKSELQACESRYQAQLRVTQTLQTELLQLYSRVEMEASSDRATKTNGGAQEAPPPPHDSPHSNGNGSTLSPGQPKTTHSASKPAAASAGVAAVTNGNQDALAPLLMEPPASCSHGNALPRRPPAAVPLLVGSYPSAKSILGARARELFRNKSESQCDEEDGDGGRPPLAGLAHGLKTELCVEAAPSGLHALPLDQLYYRQ